MTGINANIGISIIITAILYGTPLVFAGIGELFAERSGVLNLGVEGMMLMGAVMAFLVSQRMPGPDWLVLLVAVLVAMAISALMALIHAFVSITLRANQIVSGLTLTIFAGAIGLSSYIAEDNGIGGKAGNHQFTDLNVFGLKNLPVVGPVLFHQSAMVYASWLLVIGAVLYLYRTRIGLYLRSVGESPQAADAMGISVTRYRCPRWCGSAAAWWPTAARPSRSAGRRPPGGCAEASGSRCWRRMTSGSRRPGGSGSSASSPAASPPGRWSPSPPAAAVMPSPMPDATWRRWP